MKRIAIVLSILLALLTGGAQAREVTIPAGTRIMVETLDNLDSSRQKSGHRFRAQLAGDMVADGMVLAPKGSILYGILAEAKKSRRAIGKSELILTFTDITINGQLIPIHTSAIQAVADSTAKKSAGQVGRAAAIGGLVDGSSGAKTGAKVGLGAAIVTGGSQVKIPPRSLLEFNLTQPLTGSSTQKAVLPVEEEPPAKVVEVKPVTSSITVPAGTRIMVETLEPLDSSRQRAGHRFRAKLAGDMVVEGKVVASGGSILYGILAEAKKSRRAIGKAELILTFTDITINGQLVPIQTTAIQAVTDPTAKKSASQVGRAAVIGGLVDGKSGARTGAKVGMGAAIVTGGSQVKIPANTLLEFNLAQPLSVSAN